MLAQRNIGMGWTPPDESNPPINWDAVPGGNPNDDTINWDAVQIDDVVTINSQPAGQINNEAELSAAIVAAGDSLVVAPNSNALAIARQNPERFLVELLADGTYMISEKAASSWAALLTGKNILLAGGALLLLLVLTDR